MSEKQLIDQENFESFLALAQERELASLTNAAEELKLRNSGSENNAQKI